LSTTTVPVRPRIRMTPSSASSPLPAMWQRLAFSIRLSRSSKPFHRVKSGAAPSSAPSTAQSLNLPRLPVRQWVLSLPKRLRCARPPQRLRTARRARSAPADLPPAQARSRHRRTQLLLSPMALIAAHRRGGSTTANAPPPRLRGIGPQRAAAYRRHLPGTKGRSRAAVARAKLRRSARRGALRGAASFRRRSAQEQLCRKLSGLDAKIPGGKWLRIEVGDSPLWR